MYNLNNIRLILEDIRDKIDPESWLTFRLIDSNIEIRVTTFNGDKVDKHFSKKFTKQEILSAEGVFDLISDVFIPVAKAELSQ